MRHRLNSIVHTGVVAALISLAPAYCQPQPAAPQATPQQARTTELGQPANQHRLALRPAPCGRRRRRSTRRSQHRAATADME